MSKSDKHLLWDVMMQMLVLLKHSIYHHTVMFGEQAYDKVLLLVFKPHKRLLIQSKVDTFWPPLLCFTGRAPLMQHLLKAVVA